MRATTSERVSSRADGTELRARNRQKPAHRDLLFLLAPMHRSERVVHVGSFAAVMTFSRPRLARYCNKKRFRIQ